MTVGNVLEPLLFGHSLELQPVLILLSLMVWGSLWGLTGMVLAVPITAVLKIHLSFIDHPVAQSFVRMLEGKKALRDGEGGAMEPASDAAPLRGSSFSSSCQSGTLESATLPLVVPAPQVRCGTP
jgi:ABC-type lipoprotein release transport system permease subunit